VGEFIARYAHPKHRRPPDFPDQDDLRRLTPTLVEGALSLDPQAVDLYRVWSDEVLAELLDPFDRSGRPLRMYQQSLMHCFIELWFLGGLDNRHELDVMEYELEADSSPRGLALLGVLRLFQGQADQTIVCYEGALTRLRGEQGTQDVSIPGLPALCFALAQIRVHGRQAPFERLFSLATQIERHHGDGRFASILRLLADYVRVASGQIEFQQSPWLTLTSVISEPWLDLFQGLVFHWLGRVPERAHLERISAHMERASAAQIGWYVIEGSALLVKLGRLQRLDTLETDGGVLRLVELPQHPGHWRTGLKALERVARTYLPGEGAVAGNLAERRLIWRLQEDGGGFFLEPREQKLTKRGLWSKGRKVALRRLCEEPASFDCLSAADRKLCAAIQREVDSSYYYPVAAIYSLQGETALRAAIGHPALYRGDRQGTDDQPVTVAEVTPRIEVAELAEQETVEIRMFPTPPGEFIQEQDFLAYWANDHHLEFTHFDPGQLDIARILGPGGLRAPLAAKEQIVNSLTSIAPLVTIHSDIGGGNLGEVEEIPAVTTPHLHLRALGQGEGTGLGFHLAFYYRPLGDQGPLFHPGEGRASLFAEIEGRTQRTQRDLGAEVERAVALAERLQLPEPEIPWEWRLDDPEQALEVLLLLQEMGDELVVAWPQGKKLSLTGEIGSQQMAVSIRKQRDWFGLKGELRVAEDQVIEMEQLLRLLQRSPGRFLRLDDGRILTLSRQLRHQLDSLSAIRDQGRIHPLATAVVEEATAGMEVKGGKPWREQLGRLREAESLQPELPATLQAELRDYQIEGYRWLARLAHWGAGACLADDMGLGKTLQALALILQRAPGGPTLVVAPTSVCNNWIEEAQRFAPTLRPARFGEGERQQMLDATGPYDLIVCSYGLLQSERERLETIEWQTLVADEAQAFKNANTKRSQAMMSLRSPCRIITTGTPIENHLGELWNLFRFINPGLLGSQERFNERFANPIELRNDEAARLRLKALIRPFILRRLKRDVLTELPSRTEIVQLIEFDQAERAFYEALRRQALERIAELPEHPGQQRIKVLTEITRLRQAACHPRLVIDDAPVGSAKLRAFAGILYELRENRHRALVFSQFVGHLALLREYLDTQGIDYRYLDGSTPVKRRKAEVDAFQRGEGELFLISLKAGGSGLNLTAADYVIHMDPWWNPAVEDQASDRAHRMGQTRPVTIYRMVVKETIEERILSLHAHKRDLADGLLEGADSAGRLSVDELVALIGDE